MTTVGARLGQAESPSEEGEHWQRVESLFHAALARPEAERPEFLTGVCEGDRALYEEVASLLRACSDSGAFDVDAARDLASEMMAGGELPTPGGSLPSPVPSDPPRAHPETIGPYRLLQVLGDGGMGTVYLAEQSDPLPRRVALKLIRWGGAHGEPLRRFELERQAMARLSHPTIAQVFDAGTTEHGQPYIVLEYIPGLAITEYCDHQQLDLRGRLELLVAVCDGVHHAHEKGVIHRDLKPSNLLVSEALDRPLPKIIDFGIAKALEPWSAAAAAVTVTPLRVGSPGYMSPEALSGGGRAVDARSDVYSLGVVLYELLVGMRPFESRRVRGDRRAENPPPLPPRPSQRLRGEPATERRAIARRRGLDERKLIRSLRGELDWIARRATHYEPAGRYPTAADLAADIRRWLVGQPVEARPPSFVYRTRKALRRHRVVVLASLLFIGTLVGFAIRSGVRESRAEAARVRAEALVSLLWRDLSNQIDLRSEPGRLGAPRESLAYFQSLSITELARAGRRSAVTLRQIGRVLAAEGDLDAALTAYERARQVDQARLARQPADPSALLDLAEDLALLGQIRQARGEAGTAETYRRQAVAALQRILEEVPSHATARRRLTDLLAEDEGQAAASP
ncbi:MAG: serine/threonine-protein kinase [Acidobacteriota bacterium]